MATFSPWRRPKTFSLSTVGLAMRGDLSSSPGHGVIWTQVDRIGPAARRPAGSRLGSGGRRRGSGVMLRCLALGLAAFGASPFGADRPLGAAPFGLSALAPWPCRPWSILRRLGLGGVFRGRPWLLGALVASALAASFHPAFAGAASAFAGLGLGGSLPLGAARRLGGLRPWRRRPGVGGGPAGARSGSWPRPSAGPCRTGPGRGSRPRRR